MNATPKNEVPALPDEVHEALLTVRRWAKKNLPKGDPFRTLVAGITRGSQQARKAARAK